MLLEILGYSSAIIFVLILSIVLHEWGHIIAWSLIKKKKIILRFKNNEFFCGKPGEANDLDNEQFKIVLFSGIFLGFLPIAFFSWFSDTFAFFSLIVFYLIGCRSDLVSLYEINKEKQK